MTPRDRFVTLTEPPVIERWHFVAEHDEQAIVAPDGCRDLILRQCPGERPQLVATALDTRIRTVRVRLGESFHGVRLQPGIGIDTTRLRTLTDEARAALIHDGLGLECICHEVPNVNTALQAIAIAGPDPDTTLEAIARDLGVSLRTLQRTLGQATGHSPRWWRRLARARRAAARLVTRNGTGIALSLSELAYECGFSDQAHLTRELRHWFATTPSRLHHSSVLSEQLRSPGYGSVAATRMP